VMLWPQVALLALGIFGVVRLAEWLQDHSVEPW